jgi:DNA-binding GntR family transcriptional regulator
MSSDQPRLEQLDVLNLRDRIEEQIIDAILSGGFEPGERLVESTLADQLGVSRAPVREALSALEREGMIENVPRHGHFVIDFSDKDIEEIYSLRVLLELEALRRAVDRFTDQDFVEMQRIVYELGEATRRKSEPAAVVALDLSFHDLICRRANHSRLYSVWNSMRLQTSLLIGLTSRTRFDYPDQTKDFHQNILDDILAGDLKQAEASLRAHILDARRRAEEALHALRQDEAGQTVEDKPE